MQSLGVGARHDLSHSLDVASSRLDQSTQIALGLAQHVARMKTKQWGVAPGEGQEPSPKLLEGSWGIESLLWLTVLSGVDTTSRRLKNAWIAQIIPDYINGIKDLRNLTK